MARKKKNSDGYDGDSYDNGGSQDNLDDMLFNEDQKHYIEVERYAKQVDQLYQQAVTDLSNLASQMQTLPQSQAFEFKHNKRIADQVTQTIQQLAARIEGVIDYGCRHEWDAACIKADKYIEQIQKSADFTREQLLRYQDRNLEALAAFQERKVEGLNLSERVWKMVKPLKEEVELAVDTSAKYFDHGVGINTKDAINKIQSAIGTGMSAAELSRDVRQCLQEPNKLFRRVKDKYGNLTLSKAAQLYHPGQGVYRSSYKNAMRMTRSEINMAYRQSDSMRWQQLDFVVGIKIETSNNHTTTDPKSKGRIKLVDICDELQGKYPRDFKFVGWHPQCRCHATPILKTLDEISEEEDTFYKPNYVPKSSKNAVTDTPAGFKKYMQDNAERMKGWKSTPYYIKDNPQYFDQALHPDKYQLQALKLTPEQSKLLSNLQAYANNHQGSKKFAEALERAQKAQLAGDHDAFYAAMKEMRDIQNTNDRVAEYLKNKKEYDALEKLKNEPFDPGCDLNEHRKSVKVFVKEKFGNDFYIDVEELGIQVNVTNTIIKEWLNQPHENHAAKNEALKYIDKFLNGAKYRGGCPDKHDSRATAHIFETSLNGKKTWIIVRKEPDKEFKLYSISDKDTMLSKIEKSRSLIAPSGTAIQTSHQNPTLLSGAKVGTNNGTTNNQPDNSEQNSKNRRLLIRKRSKSAKELRHAFDERIDAIKAKASLYPGKNISTEAITDAYAHLDLAKLQEAIEAQESIIKRHEAILETARRRHAARTETYIKDTTDEYHRRQNWYKAVRDTAKKTAKDAALDPWIEKNMIDALDESKWLSHLDMLFAQQQTVRKMIDKYAKDRIAWRAFIGPDFDTLQTKYGHDEFQAAIKSIKTRMTAIGKKDLQTQEKLLDAALQTSVNDIYKSAYGSRLAIVRTDIKIQALTPDINTMLGASANSGVNAFKSIAQQAQDMLNARNVSAAETLLQKAQAMKPVVDQYDALVALNYTSSGKFTATLQKGYDLLELGDISGAKKAFDEAAIIKATNDANVARRNARKARAAQQQTQQAAKPKKLPGQAENIDEVRDIMGADTPILLENYEKSIARDQYTRDKFIRDHEKIEKSLKEFFDDSLFTHCTNEDLLDERILDNGILTNLQKYAVQHKGRQYDDIKGDYDQYRRTFGHWAYGRRPDLDNSRGNIDWYSIVDKKERLGDGDYYRCGVPTPKDRTKAYRDYRSGYGDAQIVLRKENIVTTFTYGNSLCETTIPSLTNDPKVCSLDNKMFSALRADGKISRSAVKSDQHYIEIQYLPKRSEGRLMPKDMESITLPRHPLKIINRQEIWDRWYEEGVDIYYMDKSKGEVVLYRKGKPLESPAERKKRLDAAHAARKAARDAELKKKGLTAEEKTQQLLTKRAQMKIDAETKARNLLAKESNLVNADLGKKEFKAINDYLKKGNVFGAEKKAKEIEALIASQKAELEALKDLVPEYEKWHKQFTIEEIKIAHREIQKQINWIENKYDGRNDPDRVISKYLKVAQHVEHPENDRPGAVRYKTWEIAKDAYMRKRDETIYKYRKASIDENMARMRDFKTKDKEFVTLFKEIEQKANVGKWGDVEDMIVKAKEKMIELSTPKGEKILRLGESRAIRFSEKEYTEAKRNAARWFRADDQNDNSQIRKAFKEADDYMTKYAQEMWKGLTQEEKQILWLYTDGSQYINQEMLGTYVLRLQSAIDGTIRNGLADANILTSIIEKAPALKESMWMQSGKSIGAIDSMFGTNLRGATRNASSIVGLEGHNTLFMSCHAARDGAFTKNVNTGEANDVVLSVFMPKGTKGVYLEPIASYGDSKRGVEGYKWDGKKRKCAPSDQVEYLLQRGAKFRITKAEYNRSEGKWYIDVDLIEQPAVAELDTTIRGFDKRSIRYPRPPR